MSAEELARPAVDLDLAEDELEEDPPTPHMGRRFASGWSYEVSALWKFDDRALTMSDEPKRNR